MPIIINADDFGMSKEITDAIVDCFVRGAISSTTMIVGSKDSSRAAALAKKYNIPVGLHLNLDYGMPISEFVKNRSIVDASGELNVSKFNLTISKNIMSEIWNEIQAQIECFTNYGLKMTHIDSHHHIHCHPFIVALLLLKRRELPKKIRTIRNFESSKTFTKYGFFLWLYKKVVHYLFSFYFTTTDNFTGIRDYQSKNIIAQVKRIMLSAPVGVLEVMCHPGNEEEYAFLVSDEWKELCRVYDSSFINFNDLPFGGA